jgi:polysaccharide biosynthesis transport protein
VEIRQLWTLVLKWWWLGVVCAVLGAGAALLVSLNTTPQYIASATIYVDTGGKQSGSSDLYGTELFLSQNVETLAERLALRPVLDGVIENLGLPLTAGQLEGMIATRVTQRTQLIVLQVTDVNPARAAAIANEIPIVFNARNKELLSARYITSKASIAAQMTAMASDMDQLQAQLDAQRNAAVPDSAELARVENTLTQLRNTHAGLLQSYETIRMAEASALSNLIVDEPATPPGGPASPNTPRSVALAGVVGLMIAAGVAYLIEYLDDTLKTPTDVETALQLPILGAISSRDDAEEELPIEEALSQESRTSIAEGFRILRTNVKFAGLDQPGRSIVVTSPHPQEGKSTVTASLALTMAHAGQSVILVDADLRRPMQHHIFDLPNTTGLTTALADDVAYRDDMLTLQRTKIPNLQVLTTGPLPPDPTVALNSRQMIELEEMLKKRADVVLIDTPPALMVADAAIVANRADGAMLVVESGKTRRESATSAVERLLQADAKLLGVVLNKMPQRANGYSYYYYYSHYYEGEGEGKERRRRRKPKRS